MFGLSGVLNELLCPFAEHGNCIVLILMNSFLSSVVHCLLLLHQCLRVMFPYSPPLIFRFISSTGYGFYYQNFTEFLISLFSPQIFIFFLAHFHCVFLQCSLYCLYPEFIFLLHLRVWLFPL